MTVNETEFNQEMQKQKERARNAAAVETGDWVQLKEGECEFVGYDLLSCDVEILRYRKIKQKNTEYYQLVLNRTPFYAEMGGQVGDNGLLKSDEETIEIIDTKKENNLSVHIAKKLPANPSASFVAEVNVERRQQIACNHTATHLLDYALRQVLGTHVEQKGSYVAPDALRFDFSHFQKVTDEELRKAEQIANAMVRQNIALQEHRDVPIEDARNMGAMALFGEKYGDTVRVIQYGPSLELCGGTHVKATGEIGFIRILSEASVSAGVRRIEAVSGAKAEEYMNIQQDMLRDLKSLFNNAPNLVASIKKSLEENTAMKKQVDQFIQEKVIILRDKLIQSAEERNGQKLIVLKGEFEADMVKSVAFQIRNVVTSSLVFIGATKKGDKPAITLALSDDLVATGMNATQLVREAAKEIKGGGGGQPFFAQAGGKDADGLERALDILRSKI